MEYIDIVESQAGKALVARGDQLVAMNNKVLFKNTYYLECSGKQIQHFLTFLVRFPNQSNNPHHYI